MRSARLPTYLIRNQTPRQLVIEQPELVLKLSPLQSRELDQDPAIGLGAAGLMARRDHVLDWEMQPPRPKRITVTACLAGVGISALASGIAGSAFSNARCRWLSGSRSPSSVPSSVWSSFSSDNGMW